MEALWPYPRGCPGVPSPGLASLEMCMLRRPFPIALAFGVLMALAVASPPPAHAGILSLSTADEERIGAEAAAKLEAQYGLVRDSRLNSLVLGIGRRLVASNPHRDLTYRFGILNNSTVNAVSLPGGYIYVFRGLLDFVGGDRNMLAGVLAHELGHVEGRHHAKMAERQMIAGTVVGLLTKGSTRNLASLFTNVYGLKWSRDQEYDADKRGIRYAAAAGYDPEGLVRFLSKMQSLGGQRGPSWLSTHPTPAKRVQRARSYAMALERPARRR